ncbi:enoyl-CoA hydratase family protein [Streptomyces sp. NBC_01190]|uniref:enoyl-CoA hydratase family protein n=1 Tax=Streptomyces sp. NBC_01190 TaxID=2903767 RepID=UPI00386A8704|nr:enoyl-CoA hydratase family protein [Streptomyces sp. NBC_01190]
MTTAPLVRLAHDRGVAVLTLDSPHNRNALSARLMDQLSDGLTAAAAEPGTRAVLLTHTGGTFCAGADLREAGAAAGPGRLVDLLRLIAGTPTPVVAAVHGHARAGGLGLIAACDIAVAGPAATFAFTEARLGLAPAVISLPVLARADPRAVGRYFLTGETFGPAEAIAMGLVTAPAEALDTILDGLRAGSPQGLAESKALTAERLRGALDERGAAVVEVSARLFASAEAAEGMRAFLEKRKPSWTP